MKIFRKDTERPQNFRLERQMEASAERVGLLCAFRCPLQGCGYLGGWEGGSYVERVGRMFGMVVNEWTLK